MPALWIKGSNSKGDHKFWAVHVTDKSLGLRKVKGAERLHLHQPALLRIKCPTFPSPSLLRPGIPDNMPVGIHSCVHRLYCPKKSEVYFLLPWAYPDVVFWTHKKVLHSEQWWCDILRLFSILLKETATEKWLLSPEKAAGAAWVGKTELLQMVSALLETFHSPHSISSSWLQSSGLAWGGSSC